MRGTYSQRGKSFEFKTNFTLKYYLKKKNLSGGLKEKSTLKYSAFLWVSSDVLSPSISKQLYKYINTSSSTLNAFDSKWCFVNWWAFKKNSN